MTVRFVAALAVVATLALGCDSDGICDAETLRAALVAAAPGDTVGIGACELSGEFTVPAGVTLRGHADTSTIRTSDRGRALTLSTAAGSATTVEALRIVSDGCAAVVADGPGDATLRDLSIDVSRGVGIAVSRMGRLVVERVDVSGPIGDGALPAAIPTPPYTCASADVATHGIVVVSTADARLTDVSARGFAAFGALAFDSTTTWVGGAIENNVGTGLEIWGGAADLEGLRLCRSRQGGLLVESYNGLFAAGADVSSRALTVCDSEAFGLMHAGATGAHDDLTATDNAFAGVWAQDGDALTIGGTASVLTDNGFGGVVAFDTTSVSIASARVDATATRTTVAGPVTIRAGDGVHVVGASDITLRELDVSDNERVGLLLDFAGARPSTLVVRALTVSGEGERLGAIAQNGDVPTDWDTEVMRLGATAVNDAAFVGPLDIVGAIGPSCLPDPSDLASGALESLVGR